MMKTRIKHGDVVLIENQPPCHRKRIMCVCLYIDIEKHPNLICVDKSGFYLFRGQWYGNNKLNVNSYGKCEGSLKDNPKAYRIGNVSNFRNVKIG